MGGAGALERKLGREGLAILIGERLCGLLIFATVVGHITNIVISQSHARKIFQSTTSLEFMTHT